MSDASNPDGVALNEDGVIAEGRLTRKFFMSLPEGSFLVSNVGVLPGIHNFEEPVAAPLLRPAQWKKIVESKSDQRLARAFKDEASYQRRNKAFLRCLLTSRRFMVAKGEVMPILTGMNSLTDAPRRRLV